MASIGRSVTPADLRDLTTGSAQFLADLIPPDSLRAKFIRSVYAHSRIGAIRTDAAAALPGVVAIFTAADLTLPDLVATEEFDDGTRTFHRPILARTTARFAGEAIAIAIGRTEYVAVDAADLVEIDAEPLTPVPDVEASMADEVLLFPDVGTNIVGDRTESLGSPPSDWPVKATVAVRQQLLAASPIETLSIIAIPGDEPRLTIWCGHQGPHNLRMQLAAVLGLAEDDIRVRVPSVGGAFGLKGIFHPEYAAIAAAALRLGQPVTWIADRSEELLAASHGRGQVGSMTLSGDKSGRIRRAEIRVVADVGAYPHHGAELTTSTRLMATGPYDIAEVAIRTTTVVTSHAPVGPYRGAGRPEAAYLLERTVDAYAREAGLDAADVRRMSFISSAAMPHVTPTGARYDTGDYHAALDQALRLADAKGVRREQQRRRKSGADPIGLGIGVYLDRSGGGLTDGEYARVEIEPDGAILVRTGSTATGQSHATIWKQVVGDAMSVAPEAVTLIAGDTGQVARGVGTFGSRSTQLGAAGAFQAAINVVDQARFVAAEHLEARAADLELVDGAFRVVGVPGISVSLGQLSAQLADRGQSLAAEIDFVPGALTFPYGVFVAVVEVSLGTGAVAVRHIAAVNDCGRIVNPRLASDQVVGSIVQGLGQALLEELIYDDQGQLLTSTFMDYLLPSAMETPRISLGWIEIPAPSNPLGAKGIAELGCIGVPQAVVNATLDALSPLGVRDLELPLRPDRVWRAIRTATAGSAPGTRPAGSTR